MSAVGDQAAGEKAEAARKIGAAAVTVRPFAPWIVVVRLVARRIVGPDGGYRIEALCARVRLDLHHRQHKDQANQHRSKKMSRHSGAPWPQ